jgi:guanosine-3',5'-bis(diphosphate) 3'-pyrophosphohydrolase
VDDNAALLRALHFAADKHRDHRRKDPDASPYINHPIEVAETLARVGGVSDIEVLQAAILHDTIEDTDTTGDEIEVHFGPGVRGLVEEVSDDKGLSKQERKRLQIEHAPGISSRAKLVKLADKICNVRDVSRAAPAKWSLERRSEYLAWSRAVVSGCRGVNDALEQEFDAVCRDGDARLETATRAETEADA